MLEPLLRKLYILIIIKKQVRIHVFKNKKFRYIYAVKFIQIIIIIFAIYYYHFGAILV